MPFVVLPLLTFHRPLTPLPSPTAGPSTTIQAFIYSFFISDSFTKYVSSSYCLPASVLGTVNTVMDNTARAANDLPPESLHSLVAGVGVGEQDKNM